MIDWQKIATAPSDDKIVMAYFGPDEHLYGFATVGYFFRWEAMTKRLPANWPLTEEPTHWVPLPPPPST